MRRVLPALVLAFAACSSDPTPPADAGPADAGATTDLGAPDAGQPDAGNTADTALPADQGAPADTGPLDAGSAVDVSPAADADASLPPGDDGSALDAGHDAGPADAGQLDTGVDAGPGDTGGDAGADAGAVVADAGRDADVDVPRDGGVDAGPVTYDLEAERTGLEVRVLMQATCDGQPCGNPLTVAANASCSRTGSRLNFSLRACGAPPSTFCLSITGLLPNLPAATGAAVSVAEAFTGRDVVVEAGAVARGRQSLRVSFSAPSTASASGVSGVPGRTVDPGRGDLWLLGCPVQ